MPDPSDDPGLLSSVGNWLSTPGYAVRNLARGNFTGAGRNLTDFLGDIVDAPLPGDWIPHISQPQDKPEFSDVIGGMSPGIVKSLTDIVGNTATDPLSYIPGSWVGKGLGAAASGIGQGVRAIGSVAPGVETGLRQGYLGTKSALGWLNPATPGLAEALDTGMQTGQRVANAGLSQVGNIFQGTTPDIRQKLFQAIHNYTAETNPGFSSYLGPQYRELLPGSETPSATHSLADALGERLEPATPIVPDWVPPDPTLITQAQKVRQIDPLSASLGVKGVAAVDPVAEDAAAAAQRTALSYPNPTVAPSTKTTIDPLSRMLGVGGVADPGAISMGVPGDKTGGLSFVHQMMGEAANRTAEAYPTARTNPLVDLLGNRVGSERTPLNMAAERIERTPRETGFRTETDPLTGAVTRIPIVPSTPTMLPESNADALNALLGGSRSDLASVSDVPRATATFDYADRQLQNWNARIDAMPIPDEKKLQIKDLAAKYLPYSHSQFKEGIQDFPAFTKPIGQDIERELPIDYAQRQFSPVVTPEQAALLGPGDVGSATKATKGRTLTDKESLRDFLNANNGKLKIEEDLGKVAASRAQQQGRIAQRATLGKFLAGDKFVSLADQESQGAVRQAIENLKQGDPEGYILAKNAWEGQGPRGPVMEALASANKVFKPAAVYGVFFPRVGGIMKNILSFPAQYGLQGEGKLAANQLARTPATIYSAMRTGVQKAFGQQLPPTELDQSLGLMEDAIKASGGRSSNAIAALTAQGRPDLALAMQHGVADGFVSREAVEDSISKSSWGRKLLSRAGMSDQAQDKLFNLADAPAAAFQGAEQTARLGGFLDALRARTAQGMPMDQAASEAARIVQESLYDYGIKTGANRTLRTLIPFAAFQTNAIRQSAQFMAKHPAAAVALGEGMKEKQDQPLYPYLQGKTNIPLGPDIQGNPTYLTSLGLPFESLAQIPNPSANLADFGRDIKRDVIGMSHPLIKTAFSAISGQDPYFETPFGSYSKLPMLGDLGATGRLLNEASGTGLIQPLTSPLQQAQQLTDERHTLPVRLLDFLTGANVVSVDPALAEQQQLQESLKTDPTIRQFTKYVPATGDTDAKELIAHLSQVAKQAKAHRQATLPAQ